MAPPVRELLSAFDALAPEEQQLVAAEILRRTYGNDVSYEVALAASAAELYRAYDAEEQVRS